MQTKNDVDEEHNRVVRIWLSEGYRCGPRTMWMKNIQSGQDWAIGRLSVRSKNDVDEEHNRVVRIGLSEGYRCRPRTMWMKNITEWSGLGYRKAIGADQERCG